jgi:CRP-like cAMP-binding protein
LYERDNEPTVSEVQDLREAFKHFRLPEMSNYELQGMIQDGIAIWITYCHCRDVSSDVDKDEQSNLNQPEFPVSFLIAGSESFRQCLLNLPIDRMYCSILDSALVNFMSLSQLRSIARTAREIKEDRIETVIYSSRTCKQEWYVLLSGKLILRPEQQDSSFDEKDGRFHIMKGEIFGGYDFFEESDPFHFKIFVLEPCTIVEFNGDVLEKILDYDPETATDIYDVLGTYMSYRPCESMKASCLNL